MGGLALAVVPVLVLEERATDPTLRAFALGANWAIWLAFCAEFVGQLAFASDRARYARQAWFDIALIVLSPPFWVPDYLQGVRALRLFRLLRLLRVLVVAGLGFRLIRRVLVHHRFHYVAFTTLATVALGAMGIYSVEHGANPSIRSLGDAVWWSIVTATTVGYGDISPVTTEGRAIAVVLMLTGIGFVGAFTATIASFLLEHGRSTEQSHIDQRIVQIEAKLDAILDRLDRRK